MDITLKPIGTAKNQEKKHFGGWKDVATDLVIDEEYTDALMGLWEYSHVVVVYWMHNVHTCELRHVPQGKVGEVPEVGIFACRCAQRPNPIGVSTAEILSIVNNVVSVKGLDVIDGTPILDVKPYTPQYDSVPDARVPGWVGKLEY
ncbi:MAG: tRNA (N6-threonylcarbamoyladenosine(37)-N6)-methyltransferase TrmO [Candidatus Magasanikbacteria bacterium RIFCSPHIGHO2_02_FULL_51_14]|uniref:tRNA (N6-threonylcarbamoyladenosine(37)-N6)-methyltransferase TrmO n=1 Tax=Candidatus Magasanikbacteria bacterium RIFCSPHIGHO2_02_FULL_51_14 TaxID=1798683 RepID=A0A1F6MP82_9BACT|nr:MAG: tRNA (N6-threonylcarbamoyladenosine(37)-N6)-methyltransferase TrmO [Candidatus Magasanikbacteria bacterium RIFCSPHIGHO2_02_FULL_51_14]